MDIEFKKRIADYFDAGELVDFLGISIEEIVELFEDQIEEVSEEIEEFINYGTRHGS